MTEQLELTNLEPKRSKRFSFDTDPVVNKIGPEFAIRIDTGARLAEARKKLNLTQSDISNQIKLSEELIDAIENCRYDELFGKAYATGYVRAYASVVQLDPDELIQNDPQLGVEAIAYGEDVNYPSGRRRKNHYTTTWTTIATRVITIGFVLLLVVTGWNLRDEFMAWWNSDVQQQNIIDIPESPTDGQKKQTPAEPGGIDNSQTPS